MSKAFISRRRLYFVATAVIACLACVFGRLYYLHIGNQEKLLRVVERNRQKFEVINGRRGNIVDKRGDLLATTRSMVELGVDPQVVREEDLPKLPQLAQILGTPEENIQELVTEKVREYQGPDGKEIRLVRWRKLADSITERTYERIMKLGIKGVYGNRKYERVYPMNFCAAHVLGFVNKEGKPFGGVEQQMEFYLKGQDGWRETECDGKRRELAQFREREVEPVDGVNIELTIDSVIQTTIEGELKRIVSNCNPKSASIIVSEPSTGYILGLANYPTFDPNNYNKYDIDAHRNRAVTDVFEPGSVFKTVTASGVINESLLHLDDVFDCTTDRADYRGRVVKLPKDVNPLGNKATVKEIITNSSNRGVARMAMVLGEQKLYDYARAFGYGEPTGYGPGGEVRGTVHDVKRWDGLTISRMPMGHALDATAMQIHYAVSVIANEGILMQPQVVKRVFDENGETLVEFTPTAKRRVISSETAKTLSSLMADVVDGKTSSKNAAIPGFQVAGKSGTTQKIIDGRYSSKHHVASFSGFFPAENPRLLITVVVDEAHLENRVAYGGVVAGPAFKHVGEQLAHYLGIKPVVPDNQVYALRRR